MSLIYDTVRDFLFREARYLDDKQWDQWLELYAADATFWMPSWDDDDELTQNPQTEISLIWYGSREGLEDRIFRIKTQRSSASTGACSLRLITAPGSYRLAISVCVVLGKGCFATDQNSS